MNLKQLTKRERAKMPKRIPTLPRIKWGKRIIAFSALPLANAWMAPIGLIMMIPVSPTLWAKDKIRYLQEGRKLK